jgi:hypothetical protein
MYAWFWQRYSDAGSGQHIYFLKDEFQTKYSGEKCFLENTDSKKLHLSASLDGF